MSTLRKNSVPQQKFKFQYGATNIVLANRSLKGSEAFKFQYGATNIVVLFKIIYLS